MTTKTRVLPDGILARGGILDRIVEAKAQRLERAKREQPLSLLETRKREKTPGSFVSALARADRINVIAEIKRRSPSKGLIRDDFDPVAIAASYEESGAVALSVLTEEDFFDGSLEDLRKVKQNVPRLPVLRKDFVFDEYQLYEAAVAGADAILLIAAILSDELLGRLISRAAELGLDALVEVHTGDEMLRAAQIGAQLIGVNNRDLATFAVDVATSERLAPLAPRGSVLVSESGITTPEEIRRLSAAGYSAFLVGEHLMKAASPGRALRELLS